MVCKPKLPYEICLLLIQELLSKYTVSIYFSTKRKYVCIEFHIIFFFFYFLFFYFVYLLIKREIIFSMVQSHQDKRKKITLTLPSLKSQLENNLYDRCCHKNMWDVLTMFFLFFFFVRQFTHV